MACGTGKTRIIKELVKKKSGKVPILVGFCLQGGLKYVVIISDCDTDAQKLDSLILIGVSCRIDVLADLFFPHAF